MTATRLAFLVALVSAVTVVAALLFYQPLATGSTSLADEAGLIAGRNSLDDPAAYRYRYAPGAEYYTAFSIRNDGPLPVTVVGPDNSALGGMAPDQHMLLWADDFLLARGQVPGDPMIDRQSGSLSARNGDPSR